MRVEDILKQVLTLLNDIDTYDRINHGNLNVMQDNDKLTFKTLLNCINLTNNLIASEYYLLKDSSEVYSNGKIPFSSISRTTISEILKVEAMGQSVSFKAFSNHIETVNGLVKVYYSYLPKQVNYVSDNIDCYPAKLSERIFAYGVISEYCFVMGMYDDASVWDSRFKSSLQTILRPKHEIKIKQRLWI